MSDMHEMDRQLYDSMKSMFETLMLTTINKAVNGGDWQTGYDKLIEVFNNTADNNMRLMQRVREISA